MKVEMLFGIFRKYHRFFLVKHFSAVCDVPYDEFIIYSLMTVLSIYLIHLYCRIRAKKAVVKVQWMYHSKKPYKKLRKLSKN